MIKPLFASALLLASALPAAAQSQSEMNQQAARDAEKADAELNKVYKQLMATLDDEAKKLLKDSQRAWIAFRDTEAKFAEDEARGGSLAPMLHSGALAVLTQERTNHLKNRVGSDAAPAPKPKPKPAPAPKQDDPPAAADGAKTQSQAAQVFFDAYKAHNRKAAMSVAEEKALDKLVWSKDAGDNASLQLMDSTHIYYEGGHIELKMKQNKAGRWVIGDVKSYAD